MSLMAYEDYMQTGSTAIATEVHHIAQSLSWIRVSLPAAGRMNSLA